MQYFARPRLRDRLVALNGSERGYLPFTLQLINVQPDSRQVSRSFLTQVIRAERPTPAWLAVALTRISEDELLLTRDNTLRLVPDWFESREHEEVA